LLSAATTTENTASSTTDELATMRAALAHEARLAHPFKRLLCGLDLYVM
jgi:hypothetical protein